MQVNDSFKLLAWVILKAGEAIQGRIASQRPPIGCCGCTDFQGHFANYYIYLKNLPLLYHCNNRAINFYTER